MLFRYPWQRLVTHASGIFAGERLVNVIVFPPHGALMHYLYFLWRRLGVTHKSE
jgi:hypothetical protein